MCMIIIHVFQMDINCILMKYILMKYYFMCMIIIHVFQMDINYFNEILFNVMIIIHVFQMDIICILMKYYLCV